MFRFKETSKSNCPPKWLHHFAFPPAMNENSHCSTTSQTFGNINVQDGHSNGCVVVTHCHFNLDFPDDASCAISYVIFHLCLFFDEVFKLGCLFSYCWVWRVICIFWMTVLYQMYLSQTFSPNLWLVFEFFW